MVKLDESGGFDLEVIIAHLTDVGVSLKDPRANHPGMIFDSEEDKFAFGRAVEEAKAHVEADTTSKYNKDLFDQGYQLFKDGGMPLVYSVEE